MYLSLLLIKVIIIVATTAVRISNITFIIVIQSSGDDCYDNDLHPCFIETRQIDYKLKMIVIQ